jgi:hypothetical protein
MKQRIAQRFDDPRRQRQRQPLFDQRLDDLGDDEVIRNSVENSATLDTIAG